MSERPATDHEAGPQAGRDRLDARTRSMVAVLLCGAVLPLLDTTIVNVALDDLSRTFDAPVSTVQWAATGYALASAVAIPVTGWATHRFGGRQVWLAALVLFLAGSLLCGIAWNIESLIAFRFLQGIGGGLSMPILQTLLIASAGRQQATRAMGAVGIPAVIAPVLGPVLGGLLLGSLGWRWIFFVNIPVCVLGIVLAVRWLPDSDTRRAHQLDTVGLLLLSPGLALSVYGLSQAGDGTGWQQGRVVLPVAAGLLFMVGFVLRALRTATPLLDVRIFRRASFTGAWVSLLLTSLVFYGALLLLPLYYQRAWGYSALGAGLVLALQGVGALAARSAVNTLTARLGTRASVLTGLALALAGTLPFGLWPESGDGWLAGAGLVVRGAGVGAVTVLVMGACYHHVARERIADASTASRIATQLGGAFGAAVVATVLSGQLHRTGDEPASAFAPGFWWLAALTGCTLLTALLLPRGGVVRR